MLLSGKTPSVARTKRGKNALTGRPLRLTLSLLLLVAVTFAGVFATGTARASSGGPTGGKSLGSILQGPVQGDPPTISIAYNTNYVALNGTATLTLTITNPNAAVPLSGISVTDNLPAGLEAIGLGQTTPDTCIDFTENVGSSQIKVSDVTLAAASECTVDIPVEGTQVGYTHNTTEVITASNSEPGTVSNEAILGVGLAVIVTPTTGLTTTEKGGTATFYVSLNAKPEGTVVVGLTSNNHAEGIIQDADPCMVKNCFIPGDGSGPQAGQPSADAYMYFSDYNWNQPLQVVMKGQDDFVADGNQNYTVSVDPSYSNSDDPYFTKAPAVQVNLVNEDNDTAGLVVTPSSGLVTTEAGGTASFTVKLSSQPTSTVAIKLTSSNTAEGTVETTTPPPPFDPNGTPVKIQPTATDTFYFNTDNWNEAQTAVITGVDDNVVDGDQDYSISLDPSGSSDPVYKVLQGYTVYATNLDNDGMPGIVATPGNGLVTSESGTSTTFTVKLASQPHDLVKIVYSSTNPAEGTVLGNPCQVGLSPEAKAAATGDGEAGKDSLCYTGSDGAKPNGPIQQNTLYFYKENWNVPQTLTVTGVDDAVVDGDQPYQIKLDPSTSIEEGYAALAPTFVGVTNLDNDVPGGVLVSAPSSPTTSPDQPDTTFTLVLRTAPTAPVTIPLGSSNPDRGTVAPNSVTFTPENWNVPQTVSVTTNPANPGHLVIQTGAASSADPAYNRFDAPDVAIFVRGKTVAQPADLYTTLRVTPDREYGVASTDFLTFSFEVKNGGAGRANSAYLRLPLHGSLETATASFSDPRLWVEKIVTEGTEQYVQIRLAPLESGQAVSGTISFLPKSGVQPGTVVTERAWTSWDDDSGTGRSRASNAVRLTLVEGTTSRNDTGGEVQFFSQVGEASGSVLKLRGDFYAPAEGVTLWYTTEDGKSTELGKATADGTGTLVFEVNYKDWPTGQPVTIAGRGNQSGVTGSSVLVIGAGTSDSGASQATETLRVPNAFEEKRMRQAGF